MDEGAIPPVQNTHGYDLAICAGVTIPPGASRLVPLGLGFELYPDYYATIMTVSYTHLRAHET